MRNDNIINGNCWVACCDILGFKETIKYFESQHGNRSLDIFVEQFYDPIITEFQRLDNYSQDNVFPTQFSDTFLFFTRDDSIESFSLLHSIFDIFYWSVITTDAKWPLRGAIGFGQLYANMSKNIFLGSGIINAYEYAEKQNWIGYIITPEANKRLDKLAIDLNNWCFTIYPVPFHQRDKKDQKLELFVSKIHNRPDVEDSIKQMQKELESNKDIECEKKQEIIIKYNYTLKFFKECP